MKTIKLTEAEIGHLLHLIHRNEEWDKIFYGNAEHYWKRSSRVKQKLTTFLNQLNKEKKNGI
jgi:hypothetical protein